MKGKKIIIISIIINILTIGIIYNLIKKDYLNNEKIIVKAMTEAEYEDNLTSLNTSHEDYAKYVEESKKKIASAITEMGVLTSDEETLENMANNIKSIKSKNTTIKQSSGIITESTKSISCEIGDIIFVNSYFGIDNYSGCEYLTETTNSASDTHNNSYVFKATSETVSITTRHTWLYYVVG